MDKIPFTNYDFWAYLSAGFFLLVVLDLVTGTGLATREWNVIQGLIAVAGAYAIGQLVASAASLILERFMVAKLLGYPRSVLFGRARAWAWVQWLLPTYFETLPTETQKAVLKKGKDLGIDGPGEALFWPAFEHARATPAVMERLTNFLNLYGFCRNTALVAFIDAALLYWWYRDDHAAGWALAILLVGVGMTLRYLKFFRLYSVELFTAFAYSKTA